MQTENNFNCLLTNFTNEVTLMMLKLWSVTDYTISEPDISSLMKGLLEKHFPMISYSDVLLEFPIPNGQFTATCRENNGRGRNADKPKVDLAILPCPTFSGGLFIEFSYFRCTAIAETQDRSGRHGKLMNDMFRLTCLKKYPQFQTARCLVICVTDSEMMEYGYGVRGRTTLPIQKNYRLTPQFIKAQCPTIRNAVDIRFLSKAAVLNITPLATRLFTYTNRDIRPWAILVWEVKFETALCPTRAN